MLKMKFPRFTGLAAVTFITVIIMSCEFSGSDTSRRASGLLAIARDDFYGKRVGGEGRLAKPYLFQVATLTARQQQEGIRLDGLVYGQSLGSQLRYRIVKADQSTGITEGALASPLLPPLKGSGRLILQITDPGTSSVSGRTLFIALDFTRNVRPPLNRTFPTVTPAKGPKDTIQLHGQGEDEGSGKERTRPDGTTYTDWATLEIGTAQALLLSDLFPKGTPVTWHLDLEKDNIDLLGVAAAFTGGPQPRLASEYLAGLGTSSLTGGDAALVANALRPQAAGTIHLIARLASTASYDSYDYHLKVTFSHRQPSTLRPVKNHPTVHVLTQKNNPNDLDGTTAQTAYLIQGKNLAPPLAGQDFDLSPLLTGAAGPLSYRLAEPQAGASLFGSTVSTRTSGQPVIAVTDAGTTNVLGKTLYLRLDVRKTASKLSPAGSLPGSPAGSGTEADPYIIPTRTVGATLTLSNLAQNPTGPVQWRATNTAIGYPAGTTLPKTLVAEQAGVLALQAHDPGSPTRQSRTLHFSLTISPRPATLAAATTGLIGATGIKANTQPLEVQGARQHLPIKLASLVTGALGQLRYRFTENTRKADITGGYLRARSFGGPVLVEVTDTGKTAQGHKIADPKTLRFSLTFAPNATPTVLAVEPGQLAADKTFTAGKKADDTVYLQPDGSKKLALRLTLSTAVTVTGAPTLSLGRTTLTLAPDRPAPDTLLFVGPPTKDGQSYPLPRTTALAFDGSTSDIVSTTTGESAHPLLDLPHDLHLQVDGTAPTLASITGPAHFAPNQTTAYTLQFSEPVHLAARHLALTGGTVQGVTALTASLYRIFVAAPDVDDAPAPALTLNIKKDAVTDLAGNPARPLAVAKVATALKPLTLKISSSAQTITADQRPTITFAFSAAIRPGTFTPTDLHITGGTLSAFKTVKNRTTFTAILTPEPGTDTRTATIAALVGAAETETGLLSQPTSLHLALKTRRPRIVSATISKPGQHLKADNSFTIRITFDQPINLASDPPQPYLPLTALGPEKKTAPAHRIDSYTLAFRYIIQPGDNASPLTLPASTLIANGTAITDLDGNTAPSDQLGTPLQGPTIDTTAPTIDTIHAHPARLRQGETSTLTLTLSEPVLTLPADALTLEGKGQLYHLTPLTDRSYTVLYTAPAGDGNATLTVKANTLTDLAGNRNTAAKTATIIYDNTGPTVSIKAHTTATLKVGETATLTLTLSEPSNDFQLFDINMKGGGRMGDFTGSGTSYTVTYTPPVNLAGTATLTVKANTFTDLAGNPSTNETHIEIGYDTAPPPAPDTLTHTGAATTDLTIGAATITGGTLKVTFAAVADLAHVEYTTHAGEDWHHAEITGDDNSADLPTPAPGTYPAGNMQVRLVDQAGNPSTVIQNTATITVE